LLNKIAITYYQSPVGELILGVHNNMLVLCDWNYRAIRKAIDKRVTRFFNAQYHEEIHPLHTKTIAQLDAYFQKKLKNFDIPLAMAGTDFQIQVWNQLLKIPFGSRTTYSRFSELLGNPKAVRAIGTAIGANAHSIIIPCHRVVGKNNNLVGYAGGLLAKSKLLTLEGQLSLF
jgi:methylated-DNA-[protein]-cysteine S-methyltransferase